MDFLPKIEINEDSFVTLGGADELNGVERAKGVDELNGVEQSKDVDELNGVERAKGVDELNGVEQSKDVDELNGVEQAKGADNNSESKELRKIVLKLEYDGSNYSGWQWQENAPSVQKTVTQCLEKICQEKIVLYGCSRTDAGVHAKSHVSHFFTTCKIPVNRLPLALNTLLPEDIVCLGATLGSSNFHAQFSAIEKKYSYTFSLSPIRSAFTYRYSYSVPQIKKKLLNDNIQERFSDLAGACQILLGEHDFLAFQASNAQTKTTVRKLYSFEIVGLNSSFDTVFTWKIEDNEIELDSNPLQISQQDFADFSYLRISVSGNGFLYNMVRILAGTLLAVLAGKINSQTIKKILKEKDRRLAGTTLPPQGLCLEYIKFAEELNFVS